MTNKTAEWLVMVYIVGDHTLANFGIESLKQLKSAASKDVVVVAQVDIDGLAGGRRTKWYLFDGTTSSGKCQDPYASLENNRLKGGVPCSSSTTKMARPGALTAFIDWAYKTYENKEARHYALILWGHGPELLSEPARDGKTHLYLTVEELGKALTDADLGGLRSNQNPPVPGALAAKATGKRKLDILGIDACCMSLIEVACQIPDGVDLMVASQEEVPDASFPYVRLLDIFKDKDKRKDPTLICHEIVKRYAAAYQDYVCNNLTDIRTPTLSAVKLDGTRNIETTLRALADELLKPGMGDGIRQAILCAREQTQGYIAGLFADIHDFCDKLQKALESKQVEAPRLREACKAVCDAFKKSTAGVIANHSKSGRDCGLSIYFPYRVGKETYGLPEMPKDSPNESTKVGPGGTNEMTQVTPVLTKASSDQPTKASSDQPTKANQLNQVRLQRIQEIEKDYQNLRFAIDSRWGEFIQRVWSNILARKRPGELDLRYSGEQCAQNLLSYCKGLKTTGQPEVKDHDLVGV